MLSLLTADAMLARHTHVLSTNVCPVLQWHPFPQMPMAHIPSSLPTPFAPPPPSLTLSYPPLSPHLPLEVAPLNPAIYGVSLEERCKLP